MFQRRKRAWTWARRKTPISTPVVITTDAEQQEGEQTRSPTLGRSNNLDMLEGRPDNSALELGSNSQEEEETSTAYCLYLTIHVYYFSAIKN